MITLSPSYRCSCVRSVMSPCSYHGQSSLLLECILEQPAMEVDRVMLIAPVLHVLEPVARQHVADGLPQAVFLLIEIQSGQQGNGFRFQIGPDEPPHLLYS